MTSKTKQNISFKTDQEVFWAGSFGEEYIKRNTSNQLFASNLSFFSRALQHAGSISSCIEFGANVGMNLRALAFLYPGITLSGIEINKQAAGELQKWMKNDNLNNEVFNCSLLDWEPPTKYDLVISKTVLIHINPEYLSKVYNKLYEAASHSILIAEYYNPAPVTITYRGHADRLFKRDFAGEMLDKFPDLKLVDYGFTYKRDASFPQDDINWFLLERV